ncbi:uncharacterized protein BXZ73DRAFT_101264 [Epithele typhae]|uniref:uncharacterized protein n=1 Tax=Epithele typhae TaxID=378194 RepID=UPI0020089F5C|nr:uncharacterized protein BXZ73DRAFT_101264 [Epithele typhae]KAH9932724.1 hypothetical protein BXZ73DRAFT_101264 [Epithele typhae]
MPLEVTLDFEAILFDVDGTLVDSTDSSEARCFEEVIVAKSTKNGHHGIVALLDVKAIVASVRSLSALTSWTLLWAILVLNQPNFNTQGHTPQAASSDSPIYQADSS